MKYSKKSLSTLVTELRQLIDQNFRFELTAEQNSKSVNDFVTSHMKTDSGKLRYPVYYSSVLYNFHREFSEVRMAEKLYFVIW